MWRCCDRPPRSGDTTRPRPTRLSAGSPRWSSSGTWRSRHCAGSCPSFGPPRGLLGPRRPARWRGRHPRRRGSRRCRPPAQARPPLCLPCRCRPPRRSAQPAPHLTMPHLTMPHLRVPHLTMPHPLKLRLSKLRPPSRQLATPHLTTPHLTTPHLTTPHLATPHLTKAGPDPVPEPAVPE